MTHARIALVVGTAALLASCASVNKTVDGWFGSTPPAAQQGTVYFSAVDGLPIYADANFGSQVVGHLAQYDKVTRTRLESGFAYVTADQSGLSGWVDNAQLIWRLPGSTSTAPATAPSPASVPPPPAATTAPVAPAAVPPPSPSPAPEPEPTDSPAPVLTPAPTDAPVATATPKKVAPAIFDPY